MKTLAIFGSTGSIGKTSLKIYENNQNKFNLLFLSAHTNFNKLFSQYKKYKPKKIILTGKINNKFKTLKPLIEFNNLNKLKKKIDYVISGFSGYEAIQLNLKLLKISKNLLIANKETIICGGEFFLREAKKNKCNIIPIDSEHHCVDFFLDNFNNLNYKNIDTFYLIASGGPFFEKKIKYNESILKVTNHPNWSMGKKISIASSNFANKVLELFEAKILFKIKNNKLKILVERSSNVHAIISFKNNIHFPIMHYPNMKIPILNSLGLKNSIGLKLNNIKINLREPCQKKFPIIKLGYDILRNYNHSLVIIFTVLNERLIDMYIKKKIKYGDIAFYLVNIFKNDILRRKSFSKINNLNDILKQINYAKKIKII